jgi:hypothetical protein
MAFAAGFAWERKTGLLCTAMMRWDVECASTAPGDLAIRVCTRAAEILAGNQQVVFLVLSLQPLRRLVGGRLSA